MVFATLVSFYIGSLWYAPFFLGKIWIIENNFSDEKIKNANMVKIFGLAFLLTFIIGLNLALFFGERVDFK